ncbi:hypothetical protein HPB52_018295 [Rhipicephalus sanguineus]|uniref:Uncharacterized protein n=1 Tax=Rhipicephalus sanguineus TaxID=34632 RepID=A0A9D4SZE6_RHISA|nr:hypothetical protein HPB52_018295 [Rhipicephalus sanguineus]
MSKVVIGAGWTTALSKRKSTKESLPAAGVPVTGRPYGKNVGFQPLANVKKRLANASRLPRLPREHFRVIVRLQGGLNVKNTSNLRITQALTTAAGHDVSSYFAAPDNTCKGIIRNIDMEFNHEELRRLIIQPRNPNVLDVRRIKNSTMVVILFEGLSPKLRHVWSQHDQVHPLTKADGRLLCLWSTRPQSRRVPYSGECDLAGFAESAPLATSTFARQSAPSVEGLNPRPTEAVGRPNRQTSPGLEAHPEAPMEMRPGAVAGPKAVLGPEACCHGDRVGRPCQGILDKEQNNDRIIQLERENAALKAAIEQLRAEMAELRKEANTAKSEVPQPPQVTSVETPMEPKRGL